MSETNALATIQQDISNHKVFLYMKGTPDEPMCGFSAQVVHLLNEYKIPYQSRNVLEDWDIREGVKKFANWPTIPQLYVNGQFVGGCDILMEMHRKKQLNDLFQDLVQS